MTEPDFSSANHQFLVGSLFSGIGGLDLGLERAGMRIAWQSEIDPYASAVLRKHWPRVPNLGDIRGIVADAADMGLRGPCANTRSTGAGQDSGGVRQPPGACPPAVDLICGGFPCQPFSVAGKRRGHEDDRFLWPEMLRVVKEFQPSWFLGENVPGIINMALDQVFSDLEALGYEVGAVVVPACAVDAPHRRDRVWMVAHARHEQPQGRDKTACGLQYLRGRSARGESAPRGDVADSIQQQRDRRGNGLGGWEREPEETLRDAGRGGWEKDGVSIPKSLLGRVAHGVPSRVDRLKCLGNAVVPQVAEALGRMILAVDSGEKGA